jgi:DNA-binding transcriptional MerR regulator
MSPSIATGEDGVLDINSIIAAFTEDQVVKLTKLSKNRLRYWDSTGFFKPSFIERGRHLPFGRFYSFKDIVALRTLEMLRVQNGVPLQHLRKVAEKLSELKSDYWSATTLYAINKRVIFDDPVSGRPLEVLSGQYLIGIPLRRVIEDTQQEVSQMQRRLPTEIGKVTKAQGIQRRSWVIAGTRIPVASIQRLAEDGFSTDQIIREYPDLTEADIKVAIAHKNSEAA